MRYMRNTVGENDEKTKRVPSMLAICLLTAFSLALAACSGTSASLFSDDSIYLSECQLSKPTEYDGVSFMVDSSWLEEREEGICSWTVDEQTQTKLIVTTYAKWGFGTPELARCKMHLTHPDSAWPRGSVSLPYKDDEHIDCCYRVGEGKNEAGEDMYDYFISGVEWRDGDFYVSSGPGFMIELVTPQRSKIRDAEDLMAEIAETLQWDPSKTVLDSYELGYSKSWSPLDVRGT